jgi:hypothetical protein
MYGKTQKTFSLLNEEQAIKWKLPAGTLGTNDITAGQVVNLASGIVNTPGGTPSNTSNAYLYGVAMDNYTVALNETQGSGYITVVIGPHIGKTTRHNGISSNTAVGTALTTDNAGRLIAASSNNAILAYLLDYDGTYITYIWTGDKSLRAG